MGKGSSKLTRDELRQLAEKSHFSDQELRDLYRGFIRVYPSGQMDFKEWLNSPGNPARGDQVLSRRWFELYDRDKSGTIDFKELVFLLSCLVRGNPDERYTVVFSFYDLNQDGYLTKGEMKFIVGSLFIAAKDHQNVHLEGIETIDEYCEAFFKLVDTDQDGKVTLEEFVAAARKEDEYPIVRFLL